MAALRYRPTTARKLKLQAEASSFIYTTVEKGKESRDTELWTAKGLTFNFLDVIILNRSLAVI